MTTGYIPKTIRYIVQPASVITPKIKYLKPGESPEEIKVASTWVGDADIKKTSERAIERHGVGKPGHEGVKNIELPNSEIPYIEIFDTGYKGEYHGRILDRFYVPIRQIVIDEALVYGEVRDGKIIGPFVWANSGGMNLVKAGSKLHMEIIEAGTRRYRNKIKDEKLELGKIYLDRHGNRHAYVGQFGFVENHQTNWNQARGRYDNNLSWKTARFFVSPSQSGLFEDLFSPREPDAPENYKHMETNLDWIVQGGEWRSPKLIGKPVGEFNIPADFTAKVREMAKAEAERNYEVTAESFRQNIRPVTDDLRESCFLNQIGNLTFRRLDETGDFNLPMLPKLPPIPMSSNPAPAGMTPMEVDLEFPQELNDLADEEEGE